MIFWWVWLGDRKYVLHDELFKPRSRFKARNHIPEKTTSMSFYVLRIITAFLQIAISEIKHKRFPPRCVNKGKFWGFFFACCHLLLFVKFGRMLNFWFLHGLDSLSEMKMDWLQITCHNFFCFRVLFLEFAH